MICPGETIRATAWRACRSTEERRTRKNKNSESRLTLVVIRGTPSFPSPLIGSCQLLALLVQSFVAGFVRG